MEIIGNDYNVASTHTASEFSHSLSRKPKFKLSYHSGLTLTRKARIKVNEM